VVVVGRFDLAISSYHQALAIQSNLTFCSDMLSRAMEDMSYYPSVEPADPHGEGAGFSNCTRLSSYHMSGDPDIVQQSHLGLAPGGHSTNNNASFGDSFVQPSGNTNFEHSIALSEMLSPGLSMANSFSRIEGRLSLGATGRGGGTAGGGGGPLADWDQTSFEDRQGHPSTLGMMDSFTSQQSPQSPQYNGGYLDDSFE
jgi:hypothetical protein